MKMNQFVAASAIALMAKATEGGNGGGTAVMDAPKVDTPEGGKEAEGKEAKADMPEAPVNPLTDMHTFGGSLFNLAGLAKLELNFKSAMGRIKPALEGRVKELALLAEDHEDRKKSAVKLSYNVLMEHQMTAKPTQVARVASELLKRNLITEGDAETWVSYVTLCYALKTVSLAGRSIG